VIPDSKLTWFPFNPSEFLTRTVGLPNQAVGAYIKLLSYSWVNGPIPNDPQVLASIAGKGNMVLITARFFEVNKDGKLYDPRLEALRVDAADKLEANRKRTAKASANRWSHPSPSPDASVTETEDNDKDKETTEHKITGHSEEKTRQVEERTGNRPDVAPTLHKNPSVTPIETRPVANLGQSAAFPRIASGQTSQANIARMRAIQQQSPEWEAA
jgi:uncharacterized protein YdaU (DUF1376 family)